MSELIITRKENLTAIADAIRAKTNTEDLLSLDEMVGKIDGITASAGGDTDIEDALVSKTIETYTNPRITRLGSVAFAYCSSLRSINLPALTSAGISAFTYCSKLTDVSLPKCKTIPQKSM